MRSPEEVGWVQRLAAEGLNPSDDIRQIFTDACDAIGVEWRRNNATNISIARRASVAILDSFIGPKQ